MQRPACRVGDVHPRRVAAFRSRRADPWSSGTGGIVSVHAVWSSNPRSSAISERSVLTQRIAVIQHFVSARAHVDREPGATRDHVHGIRLHIEPADRDHRLPFLPIQLHAQGFQGRHDARGPRQGVAAIGHLRGACVIRLTGQRAQILPPAGDGSHDGGRLPRLPECRAPARRESR